MDVIPPPPHCRTQIAPHQSSPFPFPCCPGRECREREEGTNGPSAAAAAAAPGLTDRQAAAAAAAAAARHMTWQKMRYPEMSHGLFFHMFFSKEKGKEGAIIVFRFLIFAIWFSFRN